MFSIFFLFICLQYISKLCNFACKVNVFSLFFSKVLHISFTYLLKNLLFCQYFVTFSFILVIFNLKLFQFEFLYAYFCLKSIISFFVLLIIKFIFLYIKISLFLILVCLFFIFPNRI